MRLTDLFGLTAAFVTVVTGQFVSSDQSANVIRRALPNSPDGYAPSSVDCPSNPPVIRSADSLSQRETEWRERRRNNTIEPMKEFLTRMNIAGFDAASYIDGLSAEALPTVSMTFSGGGWRALLNAAGALKAFDGREENATEPGHLGGLLQASTYMCGLSGGSWLVGSIYVNNYTTVSALQADDTTNVWNFENAIITGPSDGGLQAIDTVQYYGSIFEDVEAKEDAGFNISLTDIWSRGLGFQLINTTDGGRSYTWSSIALMDDFQAGNQPFPIITADGRRPGELVVPLNATNYEFTPFELGTWDNTVYGFVPIEYLGTNFSNGEVVDGGQCVVGFDSAAFLMGTSSSLFNSAIVVLDVTTLPEAVQPLVNGTLNALSGSENDIADYNPNPFFGWNPETNYGAAEESLTLVDGGTDTQNIPFDPLIQPLRHIDVIFAVDSSGDIFNTIWPNGTSLVNSYERSLSDINNVSFPFIPDTNTIVNLGLNARPTFFGCNASNMTNGLDVPLIVYLPNAPYVAWSNISTYQLATNDSERDAIIANGYAVATMANATVENGQDWPACVACAILSRSFERTEAEVPQQCQDCYSRFCWDGTLNTTVPEEYSPSMILQEQVVDVTSAAISFNSRPLIVALVAALVAMAM